MNIIEQIKAMPDDKMILTLLEPPIEPHAIMEDTGLRSSDLKVLAESHERLLKLVYDAKNLEGAVWQEECKKAIQEAEKL